MHALPAGYSGHRPLGTVSDTQGELAKLASERTFEEACGVVQQGLAGGVEDTVRETSVAASHTPGFTLAAPSVGRTPGETRPPCRGHPVTVLPLAMAMDP